MTAVSTACPIIRSFPAGNDLWRIDWFGQVGYPNRLLRNSQPSVCAHLSIVDPDIPILQQTTCWVSIGTLVLLRIGDLWQNQRLVRPNPAALTTLNDVDVASDPEFIKAGASENGHFLLPLAPHPWHKGSTHSYCIRLRLDDDRHLIVPCMELVRFYFGSSSQLLRLLFRPELRRQHLYNPKTSVVSPDRPHSHINLAPDIPARSAPDVARVAGDREAWRWAARIGSSLAAPHNNGHVRTSFPFSGQTTLQARGVWLPRGEEPDKTFVIRELVHCSHPLPFQRLTFRLFKIKEQVPKPPSPMASPHNWQQPMADETSASATSEDLALTEREPGHLASREFVFPGAQRFTDLDHKALLKTRNAGKAALPSLYPRAAAPPPDSALGDPGSSQRVRPVELTLASDQPPPDFLRPIIEALQDNQNIRLEVLTHSGADGWTLPLVSGCDDVPDELVRIDDPTTGESRFRRVAVLALHHEDWSIDWVIIEHHALVPLLYAQPDDLTQGVEAEANLCSHIMARAVAEFDAAVASGTAFLPMDQPDVIRAALRSWLRGSAHC